MSAEDFDLKFRAAWTVFASTCAEAVAPEATFQVWFAHYLISQFGIDRVAREPNFKHRHFTSHYAALLQGGEVKLDAVVTREPGVDLPHYAHRRGESGSGLETLNELAIIAELKVASTQGDGLDHTGVCKDFWKLSMLLDEADEAPSVNDRLPLAYVCVLDNHKTKAYNFNWLLDHRLRNEPYDSERVALLRYSQSRR